jgi:hypothetical protein
MTAHDLTMSAFRWDLLAPLTTADLPCLSDLFFLSQLMNLSTNHDDIHGRSI